LVGPTAIGKSEAAVYLAKKINAEIISCDSMQVYKGMDILTSKPPAKLLKGIAHHLIGIVSLEKEYNVSKYSRVALKNVKEIIRLGKVPLFVGGAGLYMNILLDGIFKARTENKAVRIRLYKQAGRFGSAYLYTRLKKVDAQAAGKIHPHDTRRIVRALEVFEVSGRPISELQKQRQGFLADYDVNVFCLDRKRPDLYRRIDERVDKMFSGGLVNEVRGLLKKRLSRTAVRAIGIRELKGYFNREYDLEEAKRLIKHNSRIFAKRQLTWFRKDRRIIWVKAGKEEKPQRIANRIWKRFS